MDKVYEFDGFKFTHVRPTAKVAKWYEAEFTSCRSIDDKLALVKNHHT